MELPKVLIIGQPFNNDTGGGITLSNLFKGWDSNKLAVACSGYLLLDNIDTTVCNTYYQLGYKEHKWAFPFNYLQRKYTSGVLKFNEKKIQNLTIEKSKFRISVIMKVFYPLIEYLGVYQLINRIRMSDEFCEWLDEYNPDVIYDQTASRNGILLCLAVESYLKKPVIFHMMDDWPSMISSKGIFKNYWNRRIDKEFRQLLDKTTLLLSISEEMTIEYKSRYKKDFIPFHNTIDLDFWKKYQRKNYDLKESPTILYAGRIGLGIETSLELIAKSIQYINEELNLSVKFIMQTPETPGWIKNYNCVVHNSFVPYNDLPKVFSESDLLILPYDFSPTSIKYIRFSMPTKAPEYMITGTPIIVFAPEETAIVKNALKYDWAKIITENNIKAVSDGIKQMIENKELRKKYAKNAIAMAEKNYNSTEVTKSFRDKICSVVTNCNFLNFKEEKI